MFLQIISHLSLNMSLLRKTKNKWNEMKQFNTYCFLCLNPFRLDTHTLYSLRCKYKFIYSIRNIYLNMLVCKNKYVQEAAVFGSHRCKTNWLQLKSVVFKIWCQGPPKYDEPFVKYPLPKKSIVYIHIYE